MRHTPERCCAALLVWLASVFPATGGGLPARQENMLTRAVLGRCSIRLWYGQVRLNVDELPLIAGDSYTLTAGAADRSRRLWHEFVSVVGDDEFRCTSDDKAGRLTRSVKALPAGFRMDFRLETRAQPGGELRFCYLLKLDPEFFCGIDDGSGLTLVSRRAEGATELRVQLPSARALAERHKTAVGVTDARQLRFSWDGGGEQRSVSIELSGGEALHLEVYDRRLGDGTYELRVCGSPAAQSKGGIAFGLQFELQ